MGFVISAIINIFLSLVQFVVVIECVCSWIPELTQSSFYTFLYNMNGTFLNPIRRLIYKLFPGLPLDVSPIVLFIIIGFIRGLL